MYYSVQLYLMLLIQQQWELLISQILPKDK
jgi:hypothetical protein